MHGSVIGLISTAPTHLDATSRTVPVLYIGSYRKNLFDELFGALCPKEANFLYAVWLILKRFEQIVGY
jgi:hypothetical protein